MMKQQTQKAPPNLDIFDLSKDEECKFEHLVSKRAQAVLEREGSYGIGITIREGDYLTPAGEADPELSCIYYRNNIPAGVFLIRRNPEYMIEPLLLSAGKRPADAVSVVKELLYYAIQKVPAPFKRIEVSKGLAKFEVRDALDDIINMVKAIPGGAMIPSEVGMGTTMVGLAKLVRMDPQKLMDRVMEEVTIAGNKPSREEVARAVEEVYDDIEKAFASLKKVRDLDLESEEIPVPNSCSANAPFISNVQYMKTGETRRSNKYLANYFVLAHPEKTRQYLIKNMDILAAGEDTDDKKKDQYLEALKKMNFGDASYKEMYEKDIPYETYVESLNPDVRQLMTIAAEFTKYVYHFATRIMADEKDGVWTTEAFAAENTQIMVEPFSFNAGIGHYRGRSKEAHNEKSNRSTHTLEGFNDFYNEDNPFISTRVDAIKCRIKRLMKNEKI